MNRQRTAPAISLRDAVATVHRDTHWWRKCLGYGALAATGIGLPLAAGFVLESLDNSRRGYPTPLPPWGDPSLRFLSGLLALLIDFAFFILPLLLGLLLIVCAGLALLLAGSPGAAALPLALPFIALLAGAASLTMFCCSVAPAARLRFAHEGRIEDAITAETLRWVLGEPQRGIFLRARLASLPAYLPALIAAGATYALARLSFPGQSAAIAAAVWLTLATLVYAHLVVVQLYVAAERVIQQVRIGG